MAAKNKDVDQNVDFDHNFGTKPHTAMMLVSGIGFWVSMNLF